MSSTAIENCGMVNETFARQFVAQRIQQDCKFSRVDLAVTIEQDGELTVETVREWVKTGKLTGPEHRLESAKSIVNDLTEQGETTYIGDQRKRAKKGIIRAYDKGLEQDMEPGKLTRIEIEEKREVAHRIARMFADGVGLGALMASRLQFDTELWQTLTGDEIAPDKYYKIPKKEEPLDKTWMWLIEKVAPVLGRKSAQDEEFGTGSYLRAFMSAWQLSHRAELLTLQSDDDRL